MLVMSTPVDEMTQVTTSGIAFSPFGGQVLAWAPADEDPVLWVSPLARAGEGTAIRGGVPVCLPWFGSAATTPVLAPGQDHTALPSHGFARLSTWETLEAGERLRLRLGHDASSPMHAAFPHSFTATLTAEDGESLSIRLDVTNTDDHAFRFEEALHTYIAVADLKDVTLRGLEGARYTDALRPGAQRTQFIDLGFTDPTDRIFDSTSAVTVSDPRQRRQVIVEKENSANTVVWTPWSSGAKSIADLPDEAWSSFVCVEAANLGDDAVEIDPGATHSMTMSLQVAPLV